MELITFSHLRWDFVYQRPQHLLSRFADNGYPITFVEEPIAGEPGLDVSQPRESVTVVRPRLPSGLARDANEALQRELLGRLWRDRSVTSPIVWFYTPMSLPLASSLRPSAVVYDCMDELSAFAGADPLLPQREAALLDLADVVFTGGRSLYEVKRLRHPNVHYFPSSVDAGHFALARAWRDEQPDQAAIPHPRLGYFGVVDERFDVDLIDGMAELSPGWSFVIVGPVVKIDPAALPRRPNIHYLGAKSYEQLPGYIATWDVALIPFARNAATRYISPTKVLEYMAAGKPVVSTSIADVVSPYGERRLVRIADRPFLAVAAAREAMMEDQAARLEAFDRLLATTSWDRTFSEMRALIAAAVATRSASTVLSAAAD